MPVTDAYARKVLDALQAVRPVTSRKMFGGIGLYCGGPVFGILDDDRLYFKVDAGTVWRFDEAGSDCWVYDPAVGPVAKYREVPSSVLADPVALGEWVDEAAGAALRLGGGSHKRGR